MLSDMTFVNRRLTDDPAVWFISQFVKYMMRPQPALQQDLDNVKEKLQFKNPIVGSVTAVLPLCFLIYFILSFIVLLKLFLILKLYLVWCLITL